jgi:hypothetical protein
MFCFFHCCVFCAQRFATLLCVACKQWVRLSDGMGSVTFFWIEKQILALSSFFSFLVFSIFLFFYWLYFERVYWCTFEWFCKCDFFKKSVNFFCCR